MTIPGSELTRRQLLQSAAALAATAALPQFAAAAQLPPPATEEARFYSSLLVTWCDGLIARQASSIDDPALHGGLLCPACGIIHGRCGDAVYPLLRAAHSTGSDRYMRAALMLHEWSERTVSRPDGSWVNDVSLSPWQGITVFHTIALAEALQHHGQLLDTATRQRWTDRLARAAKFLNGFISIETGNINYPVTASLAFVLCGHVLEDDHYIDRGRALAHQCLSQFFPGHFLAGEGHPLRAVTVKGCRPVDLGYNVEESLPSLVLCAQLLGDKEITDRTLTSLKAHLEFMLPDGAWDNSWGTRNYKWSWWGSRTSDGCQPAYLLMDDYDVRFREAARRNTELMAACTHDRLLYGGPDYFAHGDPPCIHHTFTHAKALATVLDRGTFPAQTTPRPLLPRETASGLRSFPEIGTHLAAAGEWRATVTENDFEYIEHVQAGGSGSAGGHVTGGALSLLYHRILGPICTASMTEYQMIEISNQQAYRDSNHMALTPRIECALPATADAPAATYTSLNDLKAVLTATESGLDLIFDAKGQLQTASRQPMAGDGVSYHLTYRIGPQIVEITATASGTATAPLRLIVPIIARPGDSVTQPAPPTVIVAKPRGRLRADTTAPGGFDPVPAEKTFNLVPGFEAIPLTIQLTPGQEVRIRLEGLGNS